MLPISTVYSKQLIIPHVRLCEKMIRMKLYCIKNFAKTIFYKIMTWKVYEIIKLNHIIEFIL